MAAPARYGHLTVRPVAVCLAALVVASATHATCGAGSAAAFQRSTSETSRILGARPDSTTLLDGGQAVRGRYVDVVLSQCAEPLAAGHRCALTVAVTPKPGFRVYAPGNTGYTAVALVVDPHGSIDAAATTYPKAEEYFFAPLKERFRVYQAPFRLSRSVTLRSLKGTPASTTASTVTITGKLEYQACDDTVCYLSQTVPLTWTLPVAR